MIEKQSIINLSHYSCKSFLLFHTLEGSRPVTFQLSFFFITALNSSSVNSFCLMSSRPSIIFWIGLLVIFGGFLK